MVRDDSHVACINQDGIASGLACGRASAPDSARICHHVRVLVAVRADTGQRTEASRNLPADLYVCPVCRSPLVLKRGRVVIAHFAHQAGSIQCEASGESVRHMKAKALLAKRFRQLGYGAALEEPHLQRRVDVSVTVTDDEGRAWRIAVEVQDSAISVDEIKRRNCADGIAGFFSTLWVFTSNRATGVRAALPGTELRLPEEMRYLVNRWATPVAVLDVENEHLYLVSTSAAVRYGSSYVNRDGEEGYSSDRALRSTRSITTALSDFRLTTALGRYSRPGNPDFTAVFAPAPEHQPAWQLRAYRPDTADPLIVTNVAEPPTRGTSYDRVADLCKRGLTTQLEHLPTGRIWSLTARPDGLGATSYRWRFVG